MVTSATAAVMDEMVPGVKIWPSDVWDEPNRISSELLFNLRTLTNEGPSKELFEKIGGKATLENLEKDAAVKSRLTNLAKEFRPISFLNDVTRPIKHGNGIIEAPVLFRSSLPASGQTTKKIRYQDKEYDLSARTPSPTEEAVAAKEKHGTKFDAMELWWAPNEILVTPIAVPDPILVGCVATNGGYSYFEIYRWEDKKLEDGWWIKKV